MERLPKDSIEIKACEDGIHVLASLFQHNGYRHWEKYKLSDLPNNLISLDDLKRFGINVINIKEENMNGELPTKEQIKEWQAEYPFPLEENAAGTIKSPEVSREWRHQRISEIAFDLAVYLLPRWNGEAPELTEIFERAREIMKAEREFRSKYDVIPG